MNLKITGNYISYRTIALFVASISVWLCNCSIDEAGFSLIRLKIYLSVEYILG